MRLCLLTLTLITSIGLASAQDYPPATTTRVEPKQKASHVWTNDDIGNLNGDVNVMGTKDAAGKSAASSDKPEKEASACESDAWVATVSTVVKAEQVPLSPAFWSDRLFGGACINKVSITDVAARVAGDYTLDDGRRLRLKTTPLPGLPPAAQIVAAVDKNQPLIVKWQGQPLVLTKVDYIDHQYDYVSTYVISQLMLTNVLTRRLLIFDVKTHSDKDIEGSFQIAVEQR